MKHQAICLVGFMGVGKSKIGEILAARTGWELAEMDEFIVARERRSIPEIFATDGEDYFREIERKVLLELLTLRKVVIATGGGTFAQETNRSAMLESALVVWLDVPLETIVERVRGDPNRPLARDPDKMSALYTQHWPMYQLAQVHVNGSHAPHIVADNVMQCVRWY